MKENFMKAKTSHNENFGFIIEKLVQKVVTKLFSVYVKRLDIVSQMAHAKEVLTTKDVAELLGMNERIVREKINMGLIPAYKPNFSNKFLVLKSDLLKEIMSGTQYKSISMINAEINSTIDTGKYV
ncbi:MULTISPECIES: helix-turn-helix domain-containing protein [Elizabethkingia]|uniref:helix-turn-helix domain-containing protein n=1 Tax=Elizabethkingia TaxID=308865 RepID=UPI0009991394|nr:helix-turn-helix domain-containing protein [Elizabethkingia anophelis]MBE9393268.1 helix-turn-helix domain-containing protein [Elizabethkingia anophelis]MBE9406132.1 helix-turn-helix domain-containing protein [Elizabethkingia anophelis]MCT4084925.1 helix-turn-helix domain-containing protein [Elizabethkingia anophelis]MDV3586431.1 DNA-binding protein [Elizabethkingia anophelis]MDV3713686.1 DNA-binding protein [Elizabethkingia anophelis]